MCTIEVSEQVGESPAEAASNIEARIYGSVVLYTDEQLKATVQVSKPFPLLVYVNGPGVCVVRLSGHHQLSLIQKPHVHGPEHVY